MVWSHSLREKQPKWKSIWAVKAFLYRFNLGLALIIFTTNFYALNSQASAQEMGSKMQSSDHKIYPSIDLFRNWAAMQLQYLSQAASQELPLDALDANDGGQTKQANNNQQDEAHEMASVAFEWLNELSPQEKHLLGYFIYSETSPMPRKMAANFMAFSTYGMAISRQKSVKLYTTQD